MDAEGALSRARPVCPAVTPTNVGGACKIPSVASLPSLPTRMIVTFRSTAFNTSTPEKHFVSRRAYGSDLANWLIYELALHDAAVEPMIGQKDAGWIVRFRFRGGTYDFLARYRGGADWVGFLERRRSIVARLFHWQQKNVEFDAVRLVDAVLSSSELIADVRWHYADSGSHGPS
jgi:hypothetical protein